MSSGRRRRGGPVGVNNGNSRNAEFRRQLQASWDEAELERLVAEDRDAYRELLAIDPEGGEAWFDDDNNVPAVGSTRERIRLVRARIAELRAQKGG